MGIGASLLLLAVGAILTFALNVQVGFLDLDVVGWIMMAAGALGLILTTVIWGGRRRTTTVVSPQQPVEYQRVDGPPDPRI